MIGWVDAWMKNFCLWIDYYEGNKTKSFDICINFRPPWGTEIKISLFWYLSHPERKQQKTFLHYTKKECSQNDRNKFSCLCFKPLNFFQMILAFPSQCQAKNSKKFNLTLYCASFFAKTFSVCLNWINLRLWA